VSRIVQEKFEVRPEERPSSKAGAGWATDKSARDKQGIQTRTVTGQYESQAGDLYNSLPPGMDIDDQEVFSNRSIATAGCLQTGSQVTDDVTKTSLKAGFDRKPMRPTDDMYTREHNDAFYDTIEVEGVEGFVERNNYLDRL
jgi:hypothetical protein